MQVTKFYSSNIQKGNSELKRLKKLLFRIAMLRLAIFATVLIAVYFFSFSFPIVSAIIVGGITLFLLFVSKYTDAKRLKNYYQKFVLTNEHEIACLKGDISAFKKGEEFISENHYYNQDIDLFGEGSLFQHICRSETKNGERLLAFWLNSNDIDQIEERQKVIAELKEKASWRQHFQITASMVENEKETDGMLVWLKNYESVIPKTLRFLPMIFSVFSLFAIVAYSLDFLPGKYLFYLFLVGLAITGKYVKPITKLYQNASKMQETFVQYSKLLEAIEEEKFESETLVRKQKLIATEHEKASVLMKNFTKEIDFLAQRNNLLFAPPANGFFLWDIRSAFKVEKWIEDNKMTVSKWFEVIEFFDAVNSFGNYAFNHSDYTYPTIASNQTTISAKELGHPLLRKEKLVTNDLTLNKEEFFIITGANMAGKSTFLRTIALNLVMANCGLPVCAASFSYQPIKLISSMRTSDSLQNDESYFFSELKRLKFIVDQIKTDRYFIILDEILKGTNSKDKAEGSKKFVKKLVASKSTGVIATHDLSLCKLSEELSQVTNYYFDAEIIKDELYFDYTFKKGVCQNMNASFLLKKMEIV